MQKIIALTIVSLITFSEIFSQDTSITPQQIPVSLPSDQSTNDVTDKVFTKVEVEATFPGGDEGWKNYLQKNLKVNTPRKNDAPTGSYRVVIRFLVRKDGSISNISAETDPGYGTAEEVIRIIKNGPKWTPGFQNGRMVNSWRRQPVTFVVTQ